MPHVWMAPGLQGLSERDGKGVAPIGLIGNHRHQTSTLVEATRGDDAELGQVAPQCIDKHRSLPDQKIVDTVCNERRLLLWGLAANWKCSKGDRRLARAPVPLAQHDLLPLGVRQRRFCS